MDKNDLVTVPQGAVVLTRQADSDAQLIDLWLHGRSKHTCRAYGMDVKRFVAFADRPLCQVTLGDLQAFTDSLVEGGCGERAKNRAISAVKSLLAFAHRLGYLPFDVGRPLRVSALRDGLAERILPESDVQRMLALEGNRRNHALLLMLYASGIRVSELCSLRWRDMQVRDDGAGQASIFGKGGKTRAVLLPQSVWQAVGGLGKDGEPDAPVFRSRKGGFLHPCQVLRIVRAAAKRAGIAERVSPHWLRHAHASHALDRGAPIHLVQATLGHSSVSTTSRYLHARPADSSARYLAV